MTLSTGRKRRWVGRFHRYLANPPMRRLAGVLPGFAVLETTGRRTGRARRVPIGGRLVGASFWLVSGDGQAAGYVRNIEADPRVRLRHRGRWRAGTARPLPDDDAAARLAKLPRVNSAMVRLLATEPRTLRIDLD